MKTKLQPTLLITMAIMGMSLALMVGCKSVSQKTASEPVWSFIGGSNEERSGLFKMDESKYKVFIVVEETLNSESMKTYFEASHFARGHLVKYADLLDFIDELYLSGENKPFVEVFDMFHNQAEQDDIWNVWRKRYDKIYGELKKLGKKHNFRPVMSCSPYGFNDFGWMGFVIDNGELIDEEDPDYKAFKEKMDKLDKEGIKSHE